MAVFLLLLFIVLPIAELYVIIQVGEAIGVRPTLALLILDGFARRVRCCARRAGRPGGASTARSARAGCPPARPSTGRW